MNTIRLIVVMTIGMVVAAASVVVALATGKEDE